MGHWLLEVVIEFFLHGEVAYAPGLPWIDNGAGQCVAE